MSVNGFELAQIAFVAFAMCFVWIGAAVADLLISRVIDSVDRRNRKKFVFDLEILFLGTAIYSFLRHIYDLRSNSLFSIYNK